MDNNLDVNVAFVKWKLAPSQEKETVQQELARKLERYATALCWQRIPDYRSDFGALVNGIVWKALNKIDHFKGKSKFSTWFCRIVINDCNGFLRNKLEQPEVSLEEDVPSNPWQIDARIDLLAILNELEGDDHTLFRMLSEGEDFKTIGIALGISGTTTRKRWARLKGRLRDA